MPRRKKPNYLFYVYIYFDPRSGKKVPIYVGKGTQKPTDKRKKRAWSHWNKTPNKFFQRVLLKIKQVGLRPSVAIIDVGSSEEEAFELEKKLIAKYGRRDLCKGTLLNLTDGGDGVSGRIFPKHQIDQMVASLRQYWTQPAARLIASERFIAYWNTHPEAKVAQAERMRNRSNDYWGREGSRELQIQRNIERWSDPVYAKAVGNAISESLVDFWQSPRSDELRKHLSECRAEQAEVLAASIRTPEVQAKKRAWGLTKGKEILVAYNKSDAGRKRRGKQSKALWDDPVWRASMLAAQKAGKKPHTEEFKEAARIRMIERNNSKTPEERSAQASRGVKAYWAKVRSGEMPWKPRKY